MVGHLGRLYSVLKLRKMIGLLIALVMEAVGIFQKAVIFMCSHVTSEQHEQGEWPLS
jgi:hypothetical protein